MALNEAAKRQQEFYDDEHDEPELCTVNFQHYSQSQFTHGNPYWHLHNLIEQSYRDASQQLLDFGCGRGQHAMLYANIGYKVHGFDISRKRVQNCAKLAEKYGFADRTDFTLQSAEELDYPSDMFDIVVGTNILHHVPLEAAMGEIRRVLKPGGTAYFKEPLETPIRDKLRYSWPVTWFLPPGVKNVRTNDVHYVPPDEREISRQDQAIIRSFFPSMRIDRFRVLALLNSFTMNRRFLENCDGWLFRLLPVVRRFGDQVVFVLQKPEA